MKTLFSKDKEKNVVEISTAQTTTSTVQRKPYDLTDLYDELGRYNWIGADAGWEKAIVAVREEIKKMIRMNRLNGS